MTGGTDADAGHDNACLDVARRGENSSACDVCSGVDLGDSLEQHGIVTWFVGRCVVEGACATTNKSDCNVRQQDSGDERPQAELQQGSIVGDPRLPKMAPSAIRALHRSRTGPSGRRFTYSTNQ